MRGAAVGAPAVRPRMRPAPRAIELTTQGPIARIIAARPCSSHCVSPHRVLPARELQSLGHWIALDHIDSRAGRSAEHPPHPHVGLGSLTYLFEGALVHRDHLGNVATLRPGGVHWLTAGRGIVHSTRRPPADSARDAPVRGVELWVGLPRAFEADPAAFFAFEASELPSIVIGGARVRVIVGDAYDLRAPVLPPAPLWLLDVRIRKGVTFALPAFAHHAALRAVYVVAGRVEIESTTIEPRRLAVLASTTTSVIALDAAHVLVLASAPLIRPIYTWWTFAASGRAQLDEAKRRWAADAMGTVPGESDRLPLPR